VPFVIRKGVLRLETLTSSIQCYCEVFGAQLDDSCGLPYEVTHLHNILIEKLFVTGKEQILEIA
jgi:hypothetical protein